MQDLKNQLSNLIENNKIEQAIKILKEESAKRGGSLDNIIISLSSRYKRYREKSLMGLEARDQEFTKIVSDTLELVKALDDPSQIIHSEAASPQLRKEVSHSKTVTSSGGGQSNKYIQMGIGGLAVIGLIALIGIFMGGDDTVGDEYEDTGTHQEDAFTDTDAGNVVQEEFYDVSGRWNQIAQSRSAANDCPTCFIDVSQQGETAYVTGSNGWVAELYYNIDYSRFEGYLNWGDLSPQDPNQKAILYLDDVDNLVLETYLSGTEYILTYAE